MLVVEPYVLVLVVAAWLTTLYRSGYIYVSWNKFLSKKLGQQCSHKMWSNLVRVFGVNNEHATEADKISKTLKVRKLRGVIPCQPTRDLRSIMSLSSGAKHRLNETSNVLSIEEASGDWIIWCFIPLNSLVYKHNIQSCLEKWSRLIGLVAMAWLGIAWVSESYVRQSHWLVECSLWSTWQGTVKQLLPLPDNSDEVTSLEVCSQYLVVATLASAVKVFDLSRRSAVHSLSSAR